VVLNGSASTFRPHTLLVSRILLLHYSEFEPCLQYHYDGLDDGDHIVRVTNLGASSNDFFDLDQIVVSSYSGSNTSSGSPTTSGDPGFNGTRGASSHTGLIAGAVIGALTFIAFVIGLWWFARRYSDKLSHKDGDTQECLDSEASLREVVGTQLSSQNLPPSPHTANSYRTFPFESWTA
jgi:hypothetical protein